MKHPDGLWTQQSCGEALGVMAVRRRPAAQQRLGCVQEGKRCWAHPPASAAAESLSANADFSALLSAWRPMSAGSRLMVDHPGDGSNGACIFTRDEQTGNGLECLLEQPCPVSSSTFVY